MWPECTVLRENEVGELEEGKLIDMPVDHVLTAFTECDGMLFEQKSDLICLSV